MNIMYSLFKISIAPALAWIHLMGMIFNVEISGEEDL